MRRAHHILPAFQNPSLAVWRSIRSLEISHTAHGMDVPLDLAVLAHYASRLGEGCLDGGFSMMSLVAL